MVLLAGLPVPPGDHTGLGGFVHDVGVLVTALALVAGMLFLVGGLLLLTGRGRSTVLVAVQVVVSLWSWLARPPACSRRTARPSPSSSGECWEASPCSPRRSPGPVPPSPG